MRSPWAAGAWFARGTKEEFDDCKTWPLHRGAALRVGWVQGLVCQQPGTKPFVLYSCKRKIHVLFRLLHHQQRGN